MKASSGAGDTVMANLHIDKASFDAIPKNGISVTPLSQLGPRTG
jgi:hypothetical protein